jgi:hypothetical protein
LRVVLVLMIGLLMAHAGSVGGAARLKFVKNLLFRRRQPILHSSAAEGAGFCR